MDSNSSGLAGKKPFFELFESLTNFLYTNTKLLTASPTEKIFEEITKTIEDLQKIKDAYKIESKRPKSQFHQAIHINTPAFPTKKILIEKIDLKPKNFIHGPTRSFGSKNDQKTQNYNAPPFKAAKELENLLKNLNLKSSVETKSSSSSHHQIKKNYSSHHDSQRNGNTLTSGQKTSRSKSKEFDKIPKLPPLYSPIKIKQNESELKSPYIKKNAGNYYGINQSGTRKKSRSVYNSPNQKKENLNKITVLSNFRVGSSLFKDLKTKKMQIISKITKKEGG